MRVPTANATSMKCSAFLALVAAALALPCSAGAAVNVWFLADGKPVPVARGGTTIQAAVEHLLAGPTAAEKSRGMRTAVPRATPLRSVAVKRRIVTVDLGERFAAGRDSRALHDRVGQLVRTLRGISGVRGVRVLVAGGAPVGLFPARPPPPAHRGRRPGPAPAATTRDVQQELVDLGFMAPSGLTGTVDMQTSTAMLGFQKWIGLARDGSLPADDRGPRTRHAARAELREPGRRIEVQVRRQLALLIEDNRVLRAVHVSTGAYGKTPIGSFRVTGRSGTRGRSRSRCGCPGPATSPAGSRSTSSARCRPTPPRTAASASITTTPSCCSASPRPAPRSTSSTRPRRERALGRPALAGGLGIVAALGFSVIIAVTAFVALGRPAASRADDAPPDDRGAASTELVVALRLGDPVLQAGAVRDGGDVILARGLEVEIARVLARRLGIPRVRFVYVRPVSRLLAAKVRPWHLAIASIRPVRGAAVVADLSDPYLVTDQAVVLRRGVPRLTSLAGLGSRITCALRGSDGARALAAAVLPATRPVLVASPTGSSEVVRTGACDAALVDASGVGRFVAGQGRAARPVTARVPFGGGYVVAVTRGGPSRSPMSIALRAHARRRDDAPAREGMARHRPGAPPRARLVRHY